MSDLVRVETVTGEVDLSVPLNREQAEELTAHIRNAADVMYILIARAHSGRVWEALEYPSWEAYVNDEFDMSRSRAYQLLDQAKVIAEIEAVAPAGATFSINEKTARDLKKVLGDVISDVSERTEGMNPSEASSTIQEVLDEYRSTTNSGSSDEYDDYAGRDPYASTVGGNDGLLDDLDEATFNKFLREDGSHSEGQENNNTDLGPARPKRPSVADSGIDPVALRRTVQACYDLYASLSSLKSMPDVGSVLKAIPIERHNQIGENLDPAVQWISEFAASWKNQQEDDQSTESTESTEDPI
jgi:gas vesicle protein